MKVYDVEDTNRFFEVLNECAGDVEIVGKDGNMYSAKDKEVVEAMEATFAGSPIREMELKFSNLEDSAKVFCFLSKMNLAA